MLKLKDASGADWIIDPNDDLYLPIKEQIDEGYEPDKYPLPREIFLRTYCEPTLTELQELCSDLKQNKSKIIIAVVARNIWHRLNGISERVELSLT